MISTLEAVKKYLIEADKLLDTLESWKYSKLRQLLHNTMAEATSDIKEAVWEKYKEKKKNEQ